MKVLVPMDGSDAAFRAMGQGLALLAGDADVTLLCVQSEGFDDASEDIVEIFDEDEDDEIFPTEDSARRMLDVAASACKDAGIKAATKVVKGNVRKAILKEAKKGKYDVVLMHRLDKSGLKEKLKMSGTEWLCRNLSCSVLLVDA